MSFSGSKMLFPLSIVYGVDHRARLQGYQVGTALKREASCSGDQRGQLNDRGNRERLRWSNGFAARLPLMDSSCVLTRGYGRVNPRTQVVVSNGSEILANERTPVTNRFSWRKIFSGMAAVICNPNRVAAGRWAIENLGTQVFVLDDGFQHLKLAPRFEYCRHRRHGTMGR